MNFSASASSVSKGETLLDTVNNILSMKVDMVVMRHSASGAPHFLAKHIPAAIINAGDGINEHPTQGLLDAFSIIEKTGNLQGRKVAIIGDIMHSRVAPVERAPADETRRPRPCRRPAHPGPHRV